MSRLLRSLVCLLLICCFLVNLSPLRAHALDPVTVGYCSVAAVVGIAAIMQGLGYMAASDSEPFVNSVNACVDYLTENTSFITDGFLTFAGYRSGELSKAYAMRDLVQEVWQWLFDSVSVRQHVYSSSQSFTFEGNTFSVSADFSFGLIAVWFPGTTSSSFGYVFAYNDGTSSDPVIVNDVQMSCYASTSSHNYYLVAGSSGSTFYSRGPVTSERLIIVNAYDVDYYKYLLDEALGSSVYSTSDVSLGQIQSPYQTVGTDEEIIEIEIAPVYIDLTEQVEEFPDPNNPKDDDGNDIKLPWLPVRIPSTTLDDTVINQTQAESWTGESEIELDFEYLETDSGSGDSSGTDTGTNSGSTSTGSSWTPPSSQSQFALADLSKFFPFCIPFDLFDFFQLLNADPVAPSFTWEIQDLSGQTYSLTVSLSEWDSLAQLFRRLQLFLFVCGLAAASRKYIKW